MKLIPCLILAFTLVSCGKTTKTETKRTSLSNQTAALSEQGLAVAYGKITTSVDDHVVIVCRDSLTTDLNTTNRDRATSLRAFADSIRGNDKVEFTGGKRVDVFIVEMAINNAILKLEKSLTSSNCPSELIGYQRVY